MSTNVISFLLTAIFLFFPMLSFGQVSGSGGVVIHDGKINTGGTNNASSNWVESVFLKKIADSSLNMGTNPIIFGGETRTNWGSSTSATNWSLYSAITNLNMNGHSITNIGTNSLTFEDGTDLSAQLVRQINVILTNAVTKNESVIMLAPLTNESGFYGNGAGLTNVSVPSTNELRNDISSETNRALSAETNIQNDIIEIKAVTNTFVLTNDSRVLDFTNAIIKIPNAVFEYQPVTFSQLGKTLGSVSVLYSSTNISTEVTNALFYKALDSLPTHNNFTITNVAPTNGQVLASWISTIGSDIRIRKGVADIHYKMRRNGGGGTAAMTVRPCIGVVQTDGLGNMTNNIPLCESSANIILTTSFIEDDAAVSITSDYALVSTEALAVRWIVVSRTSTPNWEFECGKDLVIAARLPIADTFEIGTRGATNIQAGAADSYNGATRTLIWNTNAAASVPVESGTNWSKSIALQDVDMGRIYSITNIERVQVYDSLGIGQNILPVTNKMASLTIYQQTNDSEAIRLHGVDTGSVVLRGYTGNTEGFRMYPWGTIYFMDLDAEIVHFKAGGDLNIGALGGTDPAGTIFKSKYGWTASANTTIYNTKHADSFAPTTGNARHYSLWLNDTINQTGSSSGNTYGIVIDPILTSASNYVAMDIRKGNVYVSNSVRASTSITIGSDNSLLTNDVNALTIIPRTGQPALSLRASSDSKNLIDFYDAFGNYRLFMNNSGCLYYQENGWIFGSDNKRLIIGGYGGSSVWGVEAGACWALDPSKGVPRWAFKTAATFNPTAGNVDYYGLWIGDTINQAGSSGTTYGIVIDPTLTAASNYVAMDVRQGNIYVSNSVYASNVYASSFYATNVYATNIWLPVNGRVYFGTSTNYIEDQNGTNFLFMIGTNWATFDFQ